MAGPLPTPQNPIATTTRNAPVANVKTSNVVRSTPAALALHAEVNRFGHSEKTVAAVTQNMVSTTLIHAPALPPGTTKGRFTLGYLRRRVRSAGKIRM